MKRIRIGIIVLSVLVALLPRIASAHACYDFAGDSFVPREHGRILPHCTCNGDCNLDDFVAAFINLSNFFVGFAGFIAIFFFLMGTFTLIASGGSADAIATGKRTLIGAIIGIFLVFTAWTTINTFYFAFAGTAAPFGTEWFKLKDPLEQPSTGCPPGQFCLPYATYPDPTKLDQAKNGPDDDGCAVGYYCTNGR